MTKRKSISPEALDASLLPKHRKPVPHAFVLDALSPLSPCTRPMFGCLAIYVNDKIVLILRDKPKNTADNGVWLATAEEHHQSLRREFPNMRSIQLLRKPVTGWQLLPVDAPDFESSALRACELVLAGDPRIGKIPGARTSKSSKSAGRSSKQTKTSKKNGSTINFNAVREIGLGHCRTSKPAQHGVHPRSRFTENSWRACQRIAPQSRVRSWFASALMTAPNCSQRLPTSTT